MMASLVKRALATRTAYSPVFFELIRGPLKSVIVGGDLMMTGQHGAAMMKFAGGPGWYSRDSVIKAISTVDVVLRDLKGKIICGQSVAVAM